MPSRRRTWPRRRDELRKLDGGQARLLFAACDREDWLDSPDELTVNLWRKFVRAVPGNARALAMLGFVVAASADSSNPGTPTVLSRRASAAKLLQTARGMDGHLGLTYAAEAVMV